MKKVIQIYTITADCKKFNFVVSFFSGNSLYRLIGDTACSTPDPDQNGLALDTDDLEYEYEPGISLSNLEFGRSNEDQISNDLATVFARTKCPFCGSDYESGRNNNYR